ncbi:MAG: ABC transporter ATP-binding protein [Bacillaceae bacterium]|nr:ABC transporter ATP-binding protein [Bacillaceae bacterium]
MIKLDHVTKTYTNRIALDDVSVTFPAGKIIGVVGANGSGKSTLLKLIAGLSKPDRGTVTVNGVRADRKICRDVAYLPENDDFYPFLTLDETIRFFATQFGGYDMERAADMMSFLSLDPGQKVKNMSKGQRGRLKLILALARDVPVVLMDEPLSGLDPMVRESIVRGVISFMDLSRQTVLLTTHELDEVEPLIDTVVLLKAGRLIRMEEVDQIREDEGLNLKDWVKAAYQKIGEKDE